VRDSKGARKTHEVLALVLVEEHVEGVLKGRGPLPDEQTHGRLCSKQPVSPNQEHLPTIK
jgi:hypothetical protein